MTERNGNGVPNGDESRHIAGQKVINPGRIYIGGDPNSWSTVIDNAGGLVPVRYASIIKAMGVYGD
jgi:hypothetical protein